MKTLTVQIVTKIYRFDKNHKRALPLFLFNARYNGVIYVHILKQHPF